MDKKRKKGGNVPNRSKPLLFIAMAAALIGFAPGAYAGIEEFNAGMINSGTLPVDGNDDPGNDSSLENDIIRSADTADYRVAYSLDSADTGSLITLDLTGKVVFPAGYTGSSSGAYFDHELLSNSCKNVTNPLSSEPPPAGESGVSADGLKVWCAIPESTSADNIDFTVHITPDAPNGTVVSAPDITYQSDNNPIDNNPGVLDGVVGNQTYHGLPDLTVSAAPRWQVGKNTGNHYLYARFIPGSGPNGEDGYVLGYNIGVYATGSRKGLEALAPDFSIAENFNDGDTPNAQLVTWNMNAPGFIASDFSASGANGCGDWGNNFRALGNYIDNYFHYPRDLGIADSTSSYVVARGGQCVADSVDNTAKTATLNFTGVDSSLNHYPTRRGSGGAVGTLVDPNDLDKSTNQWWISSKVIAIWIPTSDFTPGDTETFTNTVTLADAQSVTGQVNPTSTDSADLSVRVVTEGGFTKRYGPIQGFWNFPTGYTFAKRDAAFLGDSLVKDAAPGNLAGARLHIINTGATPLSGHVCEKIDNTRLTFVDARSYTKPSTDKHYYDADTGIYNRYLAGTTANIVINWQLGVGGSDISNGTWDNIDTVDANTEIFVYSTPDNLSSAHRTATCEDGDATWYDSVEALTNAGHTLEEVTRVRGSYTDLPGAMSILSFIPFQVNNTFTYAANDQSNSGNRTIAAGTTVNDTYAPNQAYMDNGNGAKRRSAVLRIRDNEYVSVTKTAADPAETENEAVSAGSLINYQLQINATSSTSEHTATIRVWDVFPQYVTYVPGTSQLGGLAIADPTCFGEGVTPPAPAPFAADSVEAGYNACYWDIDSTVQLLNAGDVAGNLPLLTFQGSVSTTAPNGSAILNATAVDSTNNAYADAEYQSASNGFRCPNSRVCGFDSYNLVINATPGIVLSKAVDTGVIPVGGNYSYALSYTILGAGLQDLRILDVLPYTGDARGSNYSGTASLSGPIAKPAAGAGVPPTIADDDIIIYYTNNAPADINQDPYDSGHDLTGAGSNSAAVTNWCTEAQVGNLGTCPADFASVTGIMALPQGSGDQTVDAGDVFELIVPMQTNANAANDRYDNAFVADAPGLAARRPSSNFVNTMVKAADLVMTKEATNANIASGDNGEFVINVSNNSMANNPDVGPLFATPVPTVTVSDNLPAGMTAQLPITATDWDCSASTSTQINCTYTGALPIAAGSPVGGAITITVLTPPSGAYANTASVTVTGQSESDSSNNIATAQLTVDSPPISAANDAYTTPVNTPVAITPLVNDTAGTSITEINGVTLTGSAQSIPVPNGTVEIDAGGNMNFVPDAGYTGSSDFPYVISDGTNTATANVTVTIDPAAINADDDAYTTLFDTPVAITPLVNDTPGTSITEINGVALTGSTQSIPVPNGTVEIDAGGNMTFVPNPGYTGLAVFPYTISDANGNTATANVTVTIVPAPIVAADDAYNTAIDTPVAITPLINDTAGASITEINGVALTGNTQSIPVPNGTVEIDAGGNMTFVPNPGYTGSVVFPYTISDVNGNTATANVRVTIGSSPIVATDDNYTTSADTPVNITPLVNDTTGATINEINGVALTGGVQSIPVPNGTVEIDANGNITFVPNPGYTGTVTFPYTIRDASGNTATANVNINIAGNGPRPAKIPSTSLWSLLLLVSLMGLFAYHRRKKLKV